MTKWLALLFMILDHIGYVFSDSINPQVYTYLRLIGRLSFPLFVYYIVLGVNRTSDKKKYLFRMLLLAVISQVILYITFDRSQLNVLFSFSIYILYHMFYKKDYGIHATGFLLFLSIFTEYSYSGFLIFIAFNFIYNTEIKNKKYWSMIIILLSFIPPVLFSQTYITQLFASISGLLMFSPKYEKRLFSSNIEKTVFYIYYPMQWIIFYLLKSYIIK